MDDDSMIEPFYKTIFIDQPVETEMDLDRDIPKMTPIVGEA
jgi:hypothetical protein